MGSKKRTVFRIESFDTKVLSLLAVYQGIIKNKEEIFQPPGATLLLCTNADEPRHGVGVRCWRALRSSCPSR